MKHYRFNYDYWESEAHFTVDTEKFTPEMAKETLEFFTWDYDEDADPVDEVMKKYALEVIRIATMEDCNTSGVIEEFKTREGFTNLDGSYGITLVSVSGYELSEAKLEVTITDEQ